MTFDIWFCRILAIITFAIPAIVSDMSEIDRAAIYTMCLVLMCTAMILRHLRDKP